MSQRCLLSCSDCGKIPSISSSMLICPDCGGKLTITYDYDVLCKTFDKDEIKNRGPGVWKYFELLPLEKESNIISLGEGGTFLQKCNRLAKTLDVRNLYLKNETTNPTGSFIDRGMTVLVSTALEAEVRSLSCAPAGNLGASLAAYAAKSGLKCRISLSSEIDLGKLYQMIAYNANLVLEDSFRTAPHSLEERCEQELVVTPANPFFMEGEKTLGFEVCEQLGWTAPSRIILPMGTGGMISMVWKGIQELVRLGFAEQASSRMTGVQAEGCCPIVRAFRNQRDEIEPFREPRTFAIDIRIGDPPLGQMALKTIKDSNGTAISVSDSEILEAISLLAKTEGVFAEPAGASTIAGLKELIELGEIDKDEEIVCVVTGSGLKDPSVVDRLVGDQRRVKMFVYGVEGRKLTAKLGETKVRILRILLDKEMHGYGVWKTLGEDYSLKITIPSVYQHLLELEALNLLRRGEARSIVGRRERRYYALTEKGREALDTLGRIGP